MLARTNRNKGRKEDVVTNIHSRCDGQGNQGLVLHDDVLAGGHGDQVLNSTRLCNSTNHFLFGVNETKTKKTQTRSQAEQKEPSVSQAGGVEEPTGLRLCLMRAASRRLASPFTPPCSLVSHQSMI